MVAVTPELLATGWLRLKLALVAGLIGYHIWCHRLMSDCTPAATVTHRRGIACSTRRRRCC